MIGAITAGLYGTGAAPVVPGNFYSIQTQTVGAGGAASITFSSIPSTYKHLQIRVISASGAGTYGDNKMTFSGDNTVTNYTRHDIYGNGTTTGAEGVASASNTAAIDFYSGGSNFGAMVIDILDYTSTTKAKVGRGLSGIDNNGSGIIAFTSGMWITTNAGITSITFTSSGTYQQYSSFALYGVL